MDELEIVQNKLGRQDTNNLINSNIQLQKDLELILEQEEVLRRQKSRELWLIARDQNISFFMPLQLSEERRIETLQNENGVWVEEKAEVEALVVNFYRSLYQIPLTEMFPITTPHGRFLVLHESVWAAIMAVVNDVEITKSTVLPTGLNYTLITLIPKIDNPVHVRNFRPISLRNVLYKTITKVLANRMQSPLVNLLARIKGEIAHSMRYKKGAKGWMVLKVDLEKAYDRLQWDFLVDTLVDAGFLEIWINWWRALLTHLCRCLLMMNFLPSRGIRLGDPISSYLFILCFERLSHMITNLVESKRWKAIRLSRGGP
ncbi:LOW QUALITY PROTEIN: hypothetical protein V2J09_015682 [Rumex salicifolius]